MRSKVLIPFGCSIIGLGNLAFGAAQEEGPLDTTGLVAPDYGRCRGSDDCGPRTYCAKRIGDCDAKGRCRPRPEVCREYYEPVCGCDGETYPNACFAAMAGVSVSHRGACPPPPCLENGDCAPDKEYCAKPPGHCDGEGRCHERPLFCKEIYEPVCGCDGQTYPNACEAAAAGVNVSHRAECAQVCGGIGGTPCPDGQFCRLPNGECCCDIQGVCTPIPEACPDIYDPVCGCDGVTYGNRCEAHKAGQSVDHPGPCRRGCAGNEDCPDQAFCQRPAGHCDAVGECQRRPQSCPDIWQPVCGCDGETYSNACDAAAAGVSIHSRGPCR